MIQHKVIDGLLLRDMLIAGANLLEQNREAVDALNVFPVPDGDTGTNMSLTMQSAVREINAIKITGYTVIHKKNGYGYSDFQKKLENSGRFSEVKSVENFNASELGGVNMTKFVCVAKLKEPMKK